MLDTEFHNGEGSTCCSPLKSVGLCFGLQLGYLQISLILSLCASLAKVSLECSLLRACVGLLPTLEMPILTGKNLMSPSLYQLWELFNL